MKTNYILLKFTLDEKTKAAIEKKLKRLAKFFSDETEAVIVLTAEKTSEIVEITIKEKGMFYRSEERDITVLNAIDKAIDIIERQIRKNKTKLEKRLRSDVFEVFENDDYDYEEEVFDIEKVKRFPCKPVSVEEAILQMNLLGHEFYIFKNEETDEINVVYKKKNNKYGLIEPVDA